MIPTFRIAEKNEDGTFSLVRGYILDNRHDAKITLDVLSNGKSLRNFAIVKAVWGTNGREIIGWTFIE